MFQMKYRMTRESLALSLLFAAVAFTPASVLRAQDPPTNDILYIGNGSDNSIKRFDAASGAFLDREKGALVLAKYSNGLDGPRGIIIDSSQGVDDLVVANQNVFQTFSGEILSYAASDGQFLQAIVPCNPPQQRDCDPNAPFTARGIVRGFEHHLVVADMGLCCNDNGNFTANGSVAEFDERGKFLGKLDFGDFQGDKGWYHPRAVVFGPDGKLYVSVTGKIDAPDDPTAPNSGPRAGYILRFENGKPFKLFSSTQHGCPDLHRPEGLTFGPDGKLYVASFRAGPTDTDKIVVLEADGSCPSNIVLDTVRVRDTDPDPRAYAQALLFGPDGRLFVPITNIGIKNKFAGDVRRYDVRTKTFTVFVKGFSASAAGSTEPWYLTFGKTDPGTLAYRP